MAIDLAREPDVAAADPEAPGGVLTARGEAAVHLIRFEDAWAELGAEDRAYFAGALEDLAREARVAG